MRHCDVGGGSGPKLLLSKCPPSSLRSGCCQLQQAACTMTIAVLRTSTVQTSHTPSFALSLQLSSPHTNTPLALSPSLGPLSLLLPGFVQTDFEGGGRPGMEQVKIAQTALLKRNLPLVSVSVCDPCPISLFAPPPLCHAVQLLRGILRCQRRVV
jgi:hypothetical protein